MSCKGQEMPTLGILGMTAHKIGKLALFILWKK